VEEKSVGIKNQGLNDLLIDNEQVKWMVLIGIKWDVRTVLRGRERREREDQIHDTIHTR